MGNKLVVCCIVGILLGFLVPVIFPWDRYVTLMIGMIGGLAVGYLLDKRDGDRETEASARVTGQKAAEAARLLEKARAELGDRQADDEIDDEEDLELYEEEDPMEPIHDYEAEAREQEQKLSDAEELLRQARERMKQ